MKMMLRFRILDQPLVLILFCFFPHLSVIVFGHVYYKQKCILKSQLLHKKIKVTKNISLTQPITRSEKKYAQEYDFRNKYHQQQLILNGEELLGPQWTQLVSRINHGDLLSFQKWIYCGLFVAQEFGEINTLWFTTKEIMFKCIFFFFVCKKHCILIETILEHKGFLETDYKLVNENQTNIQLSKISNFKYDSWFHIKETNKIVIFQLTKKSNITYQSQAGQPFFLRDVPANSFMVINKRCTN